MTLPCAKDQEKKHQHVKPRSTGPGDRSSPARGPEYGTESIVISLNEQTCSFRCKYSVVRVWIDSHSLYRARSRNMREIGSQLFSNEGFKHSDKDSRSWKPKYCKSHENYRHQLPASEDDRAPGSLPAFSPTVLLRSPPLFAVCSLQSHTTRAALRLRAELWIIHSLGHYGVLYRQSGRSNLVSETRVGSHANGACEKE